ncbi:MAG TPA: cyanophycin synthetase [Clostridia bacterium]|nr:cyanophycin synthetase [Clostridia bacterium]
MRVISMRALEGPNIYCHRPVMVMTLDLERYGLTRTSETGGFCGRLLDLLPGLKNHCCSLGEKGGFVLKLRQGTYLGHVVEHVVLELQALTGADVNFGKTVAASDMGESVYRVIYEYRSSMVAAYLGKRAVALVEALLRGDAFDLAGIIGEAKRIALETDLGPSTGAIVQEAKSQGIPVTRLNEGSLVQLGYGKHRKIIEATIAWNTRAVGVDIAQDKVLTKRMLENAGIPVPRGRTARGAREAVDVAREIGYPVAVKPVNGSQGRGVTLDLRSESEVRNAYKIASYYCPSVLVERYISGKHYRLLVVGDRVVAASERIPAHVIGDGIHDIETLIEIANASELRGEGHEKPLTKIAVDPVVLAFLVKQGRSLKYVPAPGEVIFLRENANLSTGGTARDVTDLVHPDNALIAVRAAQVVGLDVAGVDLVARDISLPIDAEEARGGWGAWGAVIEVNACPGLRMHLYPSEGRSRPVAQALVETMFPRGHDGRIPIVSVTGTNGKTTVSRLVARMLKKAGYKVGLACTDGVFVDGRRILHADASGPRSARMVLSDPEVEAAVLEVARGGIIREGLGFDRCDVAVVTNVRGDHLGQDGVDTLEDLIWVKSLTVEVVKREGHAVLNADDSSAAFMSERCPGSVIYFSTHPGNVRVRRHVFQGGKAVYLKSGKVFAVLPQAENASVDMGCAQNRGNRTGYARRTEYIADVKDIPLCFEGRARFNVENVLAAVGVGVALNLPREVIVGTLKEFEPNEIDNPGRFNLIEALNEVKKDSISVVIDYGHNEDALRSTLALARGLCKGGRVISVICSPGDRRDDCIRAIGRAAAQSDLVIVKEDVDLRGRRPEEAARLLVDGLKEAGFSDDRIMVELDEAKAIDLAVRLAVPGDILVVYYEKYGRVVAAIEDALKRAHYVPVKNVPIKTSGGDVDIMHRDEGDANPQGGIQNVVGCGGRFKEGVRSAKIPGAIPEALKKECGENLYGGWNEEGEGEVRAASGDAVFISSNDRSD